MRVSHRWAAGSCHSLLLGQQAVNVITAILQRSNPLLGRRLTPALLRVEDQQLEPRPLDQRSARLGLPLELDPGMLARLALRVTHG